MGATIGKIHTVFTTGSITITVFMLFKIITRVVIEDSITILIESWGIISRFVVRIGVVNGLVDRGWVVDRSRLIDRGRCWVVDRGRLIDRGWVVHWSRGMVIVLVMGIEDRLGMEVVMGMGIKVSMRTGTEVVKRIGRCNERIMHKIGRTPNIGGSQSQEG